MNVTDLPFFKHIKWRPDARELRRFAVAMLIGFSLLGLFSVWRAGEMTKGSIVLWGVGTFLAVAAFVPKLGRVAYLGVYLPTSVIGFLVSHVILVLMFFLVITPLGMILRLTRKDLLQQRRQSRKSHWTLVRSTRTNDSYYRQF